MRSNNLSLKLLALVSLAIAPTAVLAGDQVDTAGVTPAGTAFSYQGKLNQGGVPVNSTCDFEFSLWDAAIGPSQIRSTLSANNVTVTNGLFTEQLDFGADAFNGNARWLRIAVRCPAGAGVFTPLTPRQPLTPAPIALTLPGLWTQQNATSPNLIGGFSGNSVTAGVVGATISGGGQAAPVGANRVTDAFGTVGGGRNNQAGNNAGTTSDAGSATVGGGKDNLASAFTSTVGGGFNNIANQDLATVSGGLSNTASGDSSTVGGGEQNTASGIDSVVGGGSGNIASGDCSFVPGGCSNFAGGDGSFAGGTGARAEHQGAFVWGDSSASETASTGPNQFIVRASGGIWLGSDNSPDIPKGQFLATSTGAYLGRGGVWANNCDAALKENFVAVDAREILQRVTALTINSWNYRAESDSVRHIGPMAQDFSAAFALGRDDTHIATLDADGVALAAIQGLNELVREREKEITDLKARLGALETLVRQFISPSQGGAR